MGYTLKPEEASPPAGGPTKADVSGKRLFSLFRIIQYFFRNISIFSQPRYNITGIESFQI
jgi:hypothetical protein